MPSWTGSRGTPHRKAVIFGLVAVSTAVLLLSGLMMESSVKQVYWAVYSRVHPMRGNSEKYSEHCYLSRPRPLKLAYDCCNGVFHI